MVVRLAPVYALAPLSYLVVVTMSHTRDVIRVVVHVHVAFGKYSHIEGTRRPVMSLFHVNVFLSAAVHACVRVVDHPLHVSRPILHAPTCELLHPRSLSPSSPLSRGYSVELLR